MNEFILYNNFKFSIFLTDNSQQKNIDNELIINLLF